MRQKPKGYWTKQKCDKEASRYPTRVAFRNGSATAYRTAIKNGWLDAICRHMTSLKKPDGYWNKERCAKEAMKYQVPGDFFRESKGAYGAAQRNRWLDEICGHMEYLTKRPGYWTKERCSEEAKKYPARKKFLKGSASAFRIAQRNLWLDEICGHMEYLRKKNRHWTKERCSDEAVKYPTRIDFLKGSASAFRIAQSRKWLDEICSHMEYVNLPNNYWTKDRVIEEGKKYETRTEFLMEAGGAYSAALRHGWLDEVCAHMVPVDHGWKYCIYAIVNKRLKKAYIGLTRQDFDLRVEQHKDFKNTTNSRKISHESDTKYIQLTDYEFLVDEVGHQEQEYYELYISKGFELLNEETLIGRIGPPGSEWTKERCHEEALKYERHTDFYKKSKKAYSAASRHGWLDEIRSHMVFSRKPNSYWTKEHCLKEAKKYKTLREFRAQDTAAYAATVNHGWQDEVFERLLRFKPTVWTKEMCAVQAKKYTSKANFRKGSIGAYNTATRKKWIEEICTHMIPTRKPTGYWTFDRCAKEAQKYRDKKTFCSRSGGAYCAAQKNKWIEEICTHLE